MKKKILIPTDFSKNAWNALTYALNLYKNETCTFYLLNAFQLYHFTTDTLIVPQPGEPAYEKAKEYSEMGLEKLIDGIAFRSDNPHHKFEMISTYSPVLEAVKQTVKEKDIDLIIMGTKGETNPVNILYGSNAVNVMEKVKQCPVIVVPEEAVFLEETKKEIVFATNFKTYYRHNELAPLIELAKHYGAAIRVLYIQQSDKLTPEQESNKEVLEDYLSNVVHTFHTLTNIKVAAGIHSFIESRGSNLLGIIHKKHGFFASIFAKSLIEEIGYKPQVPILVMHSIKA
ncbi:universal stress protein [Gillisia sp. M10.2A]|uniref:Universal stress protein n=1 Tax=Gillisia lutea TaxID=2909668 RepID=A0ABS9EKP1_9FLAO|nr:universal stress protein [Gillisia lutea]MCF4102714.1 universal stress protein [Gillisia lutea]